MFQEKVELSNGEGRYKIYISAIITKDGISVTITGGEKPHVGGVALAVPRPGRDDSNTCDIWIIPRPRHRDSEIAEMTARMICMDTGYTVSATAGIHIDKAEKREIEILVENCRAAARILINKIKEKLEKENAQES